MNMEQLVSVCIPCHNAARYIGAALESVLTQTWRNLEIIVVNDASTDGSVEILERYDDRRLRVIDEHCGSAAKARNRALRESTGDYIKFFDADDLLSPEMIEKQMTRLNGCADAVASSQWGRFYNDDLSTFKLSHQSVWRDMESTEWLIAAWYDARPMMQPGMFLIPREILDQTGEWDEELTLIDDFEFFSRIICHAREVLFTNEATLYYRSGIAGSLSGQKNRKAVESHYQALIRGTAHMLARRSDAAARVSCANVLQDFIYSYYPQHSDLRSELSRRIHELGGSNLLPDGPPRFLKLQKLIGWKAAKRIQNLFRK